MANTMITPEKARVALIGQMKRESGHLLDCIQFESFTLVAELAQRVAEQARAIVALEKMPEGIGQQEMKDLLVPPTPQAELRIFGGGAFARPQPEQAAHR